MQTAGSVTSIQGSIDRAHNGIVSGWLNCVRCTAATLPELDLGDILPVVDIEQRLTRRPDVPGEIGFVFRFVPTPRSDQDRRSIDVYCPEHPEIRLTKIIQESEWQLPALGAIQHNFWPMVSGWVLRLNLDDAQSPPYLKLENGASIPLLGNSPSDEVAELLGRPGLASFVIDLSGRDGLAAQNGTSISLNFQDVQLGETIVLGSYLTSSFSTCSVETTSAIHLPRLTNREAERINSLSPNQFGRYLSIDYSIPENHQWLEFLRRNGVPEKPSLAWIALHQMLLNPIAVTHLLPPSALEALYSKPPIANQTANSSTQNYLEFINQLTGKQLELRSGNLTRTQPEVVQATGSETELNVCVVGLVNHKSGLGQNSNNSVTALALSGVHVCDAPLYPFPGGWNPYLATRSGSVCNLGDHTLLLHLPIDRIPETFSMQPALATAKRTIGYFMWETETLPVDLYRGLELVDEIWTATEFVADALRACTTKPVHVTGHAVDPRLKEVSESSRYKFGLGDDQFIVHFSFDANSTVARKNPNAALRAFSAAFGSDPDCIFLLKIRNFQQVEALAQRGCEHSQELLQTIATMSNIRLFTAEMDHLETIQLMAQADCYLSLHRSEGFGYTIAEALSLGIHTIATGYSGCDSFRSFEHFHPVNFQMRQILPGEYFYSEEGMAWAEADIQMASDLLKDLRSATSNPTDQFQPRVTQISDQYSIERLSSRYLEILQRPLGQASDM